MDKNLIIIGIIDDEELHRNLSRDILVNEGFDVTTFKSGSDFLERFNEKVFDILLLDYKLGDMTGLDILPKIQENSPITKVIMVTAFGNLELAVEAMQNGAFDFIRKPVKKEELLLRVKKTIEFLNLNLEVERLKELVKDVLPDKEFICNSRKMKKIVKMALKVAKSEATVLIGGETGTGKDRIADIIHNASDRKSAPMVKINIAAIPETLLESELFGAEKGSFTGADRRLIGKFEAAHKGTLFLDEIGDLAISSQVKILRAIQDKEVYRLGSSTPVKTDVRIIAATNQKMEDLVREKKFREDLFYRLNVIRIDVPSLRERKVDIPCLIDFFILKFSTRENKIIKGIKRNTLKNLINYHFPGNIRELENLIERAVILTNSDYLDDEDIGVFLNKDDQFELDLVHSGRKLPEVIESIERKYIGEALRLTGGIKVKSAKILGISERILRYRMEQLNIIEDKSTDQ